MRYNFKNEYIYQDTDSKNRVIKMRTGKMRTGSPRKILSDSQYYLELDEHFFPCDIMFIIYNLYSH